MKYTLFQLLLLLTLATSCKKDGLTKETQKGANTFSCLIDGKIFKPCFKDEFWSDDFPALGGSVDTIQGPLTARIYAENQCESRKRSIHLEIKNFRGVDEYSLAEPDNRAIYDDIDDPFLNSTQTKKGKIVITKDDRVNFILSGTFEFIGEDSINSPGVTVEVTSGRFDINYKR